MTNVTSVYRSAKVNDTGYSNCPAPAVEYSQPWLEVPTQKKRVVKRAIKLIVLWTISLTASILIANLIIHGGIGDRIYGGHGELISAVAPYVVYIGAIAGSILYNVEFAHKFYYNLWSVVLSPIAVPIGIAASFLAAIIIPVIIALFLLCVILAFLIDG